MELTIEGIYKKFPGLEGAPGFKLELPQLKLRLGQIIYVIGHNGSGKTLFLNLLSGEEPPTSGNVWLTVSDQRWRADQRPCGIVRQNADESLALDLTVRENIILHLKIASFLDLLWPKPRLNDQVIRILDKYDILKSKVDYLCRNLSIGERQTLALLAVAARYPKILLLDEFLAATDAFISNRLRNFIRCYAAEEQACVVVVSHDIDIALEDADKILILENGALIKNMDKSSSNWNIHMLEQSLGDFHRTTAI